MSVLSISRRPRERENSEPSNPVVFGTDRMRKVSLPHLALLQTPSYKIPADYCTLNPKVRATGVEDRLADADFGKKVQVVKCGGGKHEFLSHTCFIAVIGRIPADCYRNGAASAERLWSPQRSHKTAYAGRDYRSSADDAALHEGPPFTVVICWIPGRLF